MDFIIGGKVTQELDPMIAGKWKIENNTVGGQVTTEWQKVQKEMKCLMDWLKSKFGSGEADS